MKDTRNLVTHETSSAQPSAQAWPTVPPLPVPRLQRPPRPPPAPDCARAPVPSVPARGISSLAEQRRAEREATAEESAAGSSPLPLLRLASLPPSVHFCSPGLERWDTSRAEPHHAEGIVCCPVGVLLWHMKHTEEPQGPRGFPQERTWAGPSSGLAGVVWAMRVGSGAQGLPGRDDLAQGEEAGGAASV